MGRDELYSYFKERFKYTKGVKVNRWSFEVCVMHYSPDFRNLFSWDFHFHGGVKGAYLVVSSSELTLNSLMKVRKTPTIDLACNLGDFFNNPLDPSKNELEEFELEKGFPYMLSEKFHSYVGNLQHTHHSGDPFDLDLEHYVGTL